MKEREFISYGFIIDPAKFERIGDGKRLLLNKPSGGLWASPTDSEFGWKDWCESEDYKIENLDTWTKFNLKGSAKILVINSFFDLMMAWKKYPLNTGRSGYFEYKILDFLAIERDGYDGVLLTERGNEECHLPMNETFLDLNAWDCESIVLFNLDHIEIVEKKERGN